MIYRPKEVLQVRIHDPLAAADDLFPDFAQGVLRRSPLPVSVVGSIEYRLEDRLQPIEQRLLAHPLIDRRDDGFIMHLPLFSLRMRCGSGLSCAPRLSAFVRPSR